MDSSEKDFDSYLSRFFQRKNNLLRQSNQTPVKRIQIVTLDLSSNSVAQDGASNLWKVPTNFTGFHIEKVYSTSSGTTKTGNLFLVIDDNNTGNVSNAKLLQQNDSADLTNGEIAQAWLYWTAQSDTSVRIAFFIDVDYRSGTGNLTTIIGSVNVTASSPLPVLSVPTSVVPFNPGVGTGNIPLGSSGQSTVQAGTYVKLKVSATSTGAGSVALSGTGGITFFELISIASTAASDTAEFVLPVGSAVGYGVSGTGGLATLTEIYSLT